MTANVGIDMETVKLVAKDAARTAVGEAMETVREELRDGFDRVEASLSQKIQNEFKLHFGDMGPTEHVVQHSRWKTFIEMTDNAKKSIMKALVTKIVEYVFIGVVLAAVILYNTRQAG